ncbi:unnamed protein product [Arctia plantaginis]|uniref:Uncharacterized protein n=1 Tax=Arctia plantaginis TaxID=874455 RepID=A0A8S0Z340_ARCPL|nr:unnamed protein product [Arctia plantaginis]
MFVPLVKKYNNCQYPTWFSPSLAKTIKEKNKLHKRWKKFGNPRDFLEFAILHDRQHREQKKRFRIFIDNTENSINRSSKAFWTYVMSKSCRPGSQYPNQFTSEGATFTERQAVCSAFNSFFLSVFNDAPCNSTETIPSADCDSRLNVLSKIDTTEDMVLNVLTTLDKTKGPGYDRIPAILLSRCANNLSYPIYLIFRKSLRDCIFPSMWKKAHIIPIHKKGSVSDSKLSSHIYPCYNKIFEKIIYNI